AVIAPPYFRLDDDELLAHFEAAASACAPLPFYLYEFEARSGYAIPLALLERALAVGAAGAVSGLAGSFPDAVVPLVREPTPAAAERATALRSELQRFPFHAASKAALGFRGVPVGPEVRAPLRGLTDAERAEVERIVRDW